MPEPTPVTQIRLGARTSSREVVQKSGSREIFFAVVGHVGSGTSEVAGALKKILSSDDVGPAFDTEILKASHELLEWDRRHNRLLKDLTDRRTLAYVQALQDIGDQMRGYSDAEADDHGGGATSQRGDHAAVAC